MQVRVEFAETFDRPTKLEHTRVSSACGVSIQPCYRWNWKYDFLLSAYIAFDVAEMTIASLIIC